MTINSSSSSDAMTDEIPLNSPHQSQADASSSEPASEPPKEDTDDDEVNALLDDLHEPTEQEIALSNLKQSTSKLQSAILNVSSDIDAKLGIQEKARNVDANFGLSEKASSTITAVGSLWNQLQIKERALDVANSETVRSMQYGVSDTLEKTGVNAAVVDGTQKLKSLDEEHKISTMTVGAIAGGIDWVAKSLNHVAGKSQE